MSKKIQISDIDTVYKAIDPQFPKDDPDAKVWLRMKRVCYTINHKVRFWWFASRNEELGVKPNAVVICALVKQKNKKYKLLVTDEARLPLVDDIGFLKDSCREYGFPAGLIEEGDTDIEDRVAKELHEETGLTIVKIHKELTSKPNLISSAGLSNEAVTMVFLEAEGVLSQEHLEDSEDIRSRLLGFDEVMTLMDTPGLNISAKAWGIMWGWKLVGKLTFDGPKKKEK